MQISPHVGPPLERHISHRALNPWACEVHDGHAAISRRALCPSQPDVARDEVNVGLAQPIDLARVRGRRRNEQADQRRALGRQCPEQQRDLVQRQRALLRHILDRKLGHHLVERVGILPVAAREFQRAPQRDELFVDRRSGGTLLQPLGSELVDLLRADVREQRIGAKEAHEVSPFLSVHAERARLLSGRLALA
ncbi:MAG: hypothetical protein FWD69_10270 [Polyangiaceae bacterium]|nr:hypothetical protein [Polyangiaceae bacterium]